MARAAADGQVPGPLQVDYLVQYNRYFKGVFAGETPNGVTGRWIACWGLVLLRVDFAKEENPAGSEDNLAHRTQAEE